MAELIISIWVKTLMAVSLLLSLQDFFISSTQGLSLISSKLKTSLNDIASQKRIFSNMKLNGLQNFDPLSPEGSWFLFNQNDANQKKKNKRKKCKKCDVIPMPKEGPMGPQGPRGHTGPPGPSGGTLSLGDIEEYIKTYLEDLLSANMTVEDKALADLGYSRSRSSIAVTFSATLPSPEIIAAKKASIIKGMTITFGPGQFKRGIAVMDGKFYVTKSGIYQISSQILFKSKHILNTDIIKEDLEKDFSVFLCVDFCNKDRRLKWSHSVTLGMATATLNGLISLKRGQSMMLFFSNPSSFPVEVLPESTFSGVLIGGS